MARIDLKITNLNVLKKAVQRLGGEFKEGQKNYKWYGKFMNDYPLPEGLKVEDLGKCNHAISFPGKAQYEIGVIQSKDNPKNYNLLYDFWNSGGLNKVVGENAGIIKQAYATEMAKHSAKMQGYTSVEKTKEDGTIELKIMVN
jgi:hypothetical protein